MQLPFAFGCHVSCFGAQTTQIAVPYVVTYVLCCVNCMQGGRALLQAGVMQMRHWAQSCQSSLLRAATASAAARSSQVCYSSPAAAVAGSPTALMSARPGMRQCMQQHVCQSSHAVGAFVHSTFRAQVGETDMLASTAVCGVWMITEHDMACSNCSHRGC
jgi:hypothetical protein